MGKKKCEDCEYWKESESSDFGWCRRHSPLPFICGDSAGEREWGAKRYAKWPDTGSDDWCGEFKLKE